MAGYCSEYDVYKTSGEKSVEKIFKKESGPTHLARFFEEWVYFEIVESKLFAAATVKWTPLLGKTWDFSTLLHFTLYSEVGEKQKSKYLFR